MLTLTSIQNSTEFQYTADQWSGELLKKQFGAILQRFSDAMKSCRPEMSLKDFAWSFQFMIGALGYAMFERHLVDWIGQGEARADDPEEAIAHLVEFTLAGMSLPISLSNHEREAVTK